MAEIPHDWPVPLPKWVWAWMKWRLAGQTYPRPAGVPAVIPKWAWHRLQYLVSLRTPAPPPPPPFDPFALWSLKGGWTAWGFQNGQFCDRLKPGDQMTANDVDKAFAIAQARGYKWVGVQDSPRTRSMAAALKAAADRRGLKLVVWEWVTDAGTSLEVIGFWKPYVVGYAANVEHYGLWSELASVVRSLNPNLSLAVWTNFTGAGAMQDGTYSLEASRPWRDNQWALVTEAYVCQNPQATPANLDWAARTHLGYTFVVHSIGIYAGWTPEMYEEMLEPFGGLHSVYLIEYLAEAQ